MSRWLPVHVRWIIAILLLLLDLGLEPGSALSFVGIDRSEDEAVADLCTKDDFSWGRSVPCPTISEAIGSARNAPYANNSIKQSASAASARIHVAIIVASVEAVLSAIPAQFEIVPSELGSPAFDRRSLHRNSYIAQKRDIVLIV